MKKLLSLITAAALSFAVISCANMVESSPETVQDYIDAAETSVDITGCQIDAGASIEIAKPITVTGGETSFDFNGAKVTVKAPGAVLKNAKNISELIVDESVGDGDFTMSNCEVAKLTVKGGGANSIHADSARIAAVTIAKAGVRFVMEGTTAVASVEIQAACTLDSTSPTAVIATVNIAAAVPAITVKGKTNLTNVVASSADFKITVASNDVVVAAAVVKTADGKITAVKVEAAGDVVLKEIPLPKDDQKKLEEQNKEPEKKEEEKKDDKKEDKQPETTPPANSEPQPEPQPQPDPVPEPDPEPEPQPSVPDIPLPASVGINELKGLKVKWNDPIYGGIYEVYDFSDSTVEVFSHENGHITKYLYDYSYNSSEMFFCLKLKAVSDGEGPYLYSVEDVLKAQMEYYKEDVENGDMTLEDLEFKMEYFRSYYEEEFGRITYKGYEITGSVLTMNTYFNPNDINLIREENGRINYSDNELTINNESAVRLTLKKANQRTYYLEVKYNPVTMSFSGIFSTKNENNSGAAVGTYKTQGRGLSGCSVTLVFETFPDTIDFLTKGKEYVLPVESTQRIFMIEGAQPTPQLPIPFGDNELKGKHAFQSTDYATVTYSFSETTFTMTGGMENGSTVAEYTYNSDQKIIYYCTRKIIYNNNEYATPASFVDAFCSYNPTVTEEFKQEMLTIYEQQFNTVLSVSYQINGDTIEFVIPSTD